MENIHKYYKVLIKNIYHTQSKSEEVYAILENEKLYELLTNKQILVLNDNYFKFQEKFLESKSELIGLSIEEVSAEDVSIALRFMTSSRKNKIIERINDIEQSINICFNRENLEKNKVKKLKK